VENVFESRLRIATLTFLLKVACVMPNAAEDEVIQKLQERVTRRELNAIEVTYRVTGGTPGERLVDEELLIAGRNPVKARLRTSAAAMRESSENLATPEMEGLLLEVTGAISELIPRSQARFIPDSIVGQISVKVDGKEASFFFLADEEQAKQHGQALSPKAARALDSLARLHKRILKE
jgi:hypothetical protein